MTSELIKRMNAIGVEAKALRRPYDGMFKALGENFNPQRSRFCAEQSNRPTTDRAGVRTLLNSKPAIALRTLQSGMHMGITSPARPWFKLKPEDDDLARDGAVRKHLAEAQREVVSLLHRTGLYAVLHTLWGDLGLYGTDAGIIEDDPINGLRGYALVPGEYWLLADGRNRVDTVYREIKMTVKQAVERFVYGSRPLSDPDWSRASRMLKNQWDKGDYATLIPIRHVITPRHERDHNSLLPKHKRIASVYWEASESDKALSESGYDQNPLVASRWDVIGTDIWGAGPCENALGDALGLQRAERDKAEALRRMNRPPMNVPASWRNNPYSLMPEAVNYVEDTSKGATPAYQFVPPLDAILNDIRTIEMRIDDASYANLFLMIANLDRRQITAREVDERHEEKLLALGPVLERQHEEKLSVVIRRAYDFVVASGRIEPLPEHAAGMPTTVEYTSMLGQALKAVSTGGVERFYGFVGNLAAVDDTVLDKVDNDAALEEYADMVGVPPNIVRSKEDTEQVRGARADRADAQDQMAAAEQAATVAQKGAAAASTLAEAGLPRGPRDILGELGLR